MLLRRTWLLLALLMATGVRAGEGGATVRPFALSAGGGVSLGAYQAGELYYQALFNQTNRDSLDAKIMTGVSAGAINALLNVLAKCQGVVKKPEASFYWRIWSDVNYSRLKGDEDRDVANSLFTSRPLEEITNQLRQPWRQGWDKGCDVIFGIPVTLHTPDEVKLGDGLEVPRQTLFFVLKISGRGRGRPPQVENEVYANYSYSLPRLYLDPAKSDHFDELISLVLASGAFPGAFPAKKVRVCISERTTCTPAEATDKFFVDGGIYENQPIRLAFEISRNKFPGVKFIYRHVDADGRSYPEMEGEQAQAKESFIEDMFQLASDLVSTSRKRSLYALISEHPEIKDRILPTNSRFPRASEPWSAFFGFFDRGFREFDFLLGIYESRRDITARLRSVNASASGVNGSAGGINASAGRVNAAASAAQLLLPELPNDPAGDSEAAGGRLACLASYLEGVPEGQRTSYCNSEPLHSLRVLAQLSLWRLHGYCRSAANRKVWESCNRVNAPEPPLVSAAFAGKLALFTADELEEGTLIIEKLTELGYQFDKREYNDQAPIIFQIRHKIQQTLMRLAARQPEDERDALKAFTLAGLDTLVYSPSYRYLYVGLGELSEVGVLLPMNDADRPNWLKWDLALQSYRILDFFQADGGASSLAPLLGLTMDLGTLSNRRHQLQLGLAGGALLSGAKIRGQDGCERERQLHRGTMCDGLLTRGEVTYSFLNLFRATLAIRGNFFNSDRIAKFDAAPILGFGLEF